MFVLRREARYFRVQRSYVPLNVSTNQESILRETTKKCLGNEYIISDLVHIIMLNKVIEVVTRGIS